MKAIVITGHGDASVLASVELPLPTLQPGEVLVRIRAAAVNPADVKWRAGMFAAFAPVSFPHILGYDIAGEVIESQSEEQGVAPGARVFGMLDPFRKGGYAEYAAMPADHLSLIPHGLDYPHGSDRGGGYRPYGGGRAGKAGSLSRADH